MKKLIITSLVALASFAGFAQTSAFDKFQNVEGIESVIINKKFFEIAGSIEAPAGGEKAQKCLNMLKDFDNLKVFTSSEKKHKKALSNAVHSYLKDGALQELLSVNDEGSKVRVYVKDSGKANQINEALLFVEGGKEVVVMTFTGSLNLNDLKSLK